MNENNVEVVRQQVLGLERGHNDLRAELRVVEQRMERGFAAVDHKMGEGFNAIAAKLDQKTTPQWQAYGILITILIALGGALFYPVREASTKHDVMLDTIRSQLVPRIEHERSWQQAIDDRKMTEERIRRLWEANNNTQRQVDYLRGQLNPQPK